MIPATQKYLTYAPNQKMHRLWLTAYILIWLWIILVPDGVIQNGNQISTKPRGTSIVDSIVSVTTFTDAIIKNQAKLDIWNALW